MGSGGVLRHAAPEVAARILAPALTDHAGGWRVPDRATAVVDRDYLLFAVGLLAPTDPTRARALARASRGAPKSGDSCRCRPLASGHE